jgi:hypothetical protein
MSDLITVPKTSTYYAVYGPKGFKCHVLAGASRDALRIARDNGLSTPKGTTAIRVGREGYFAALRNAFGV